MHTRKTRERLCCGTLGGLKWNTQKAASLNLSNSERITTEWVFYWFFSGSTPLSLFLWFDGEVLRILVDLLNPHLWIFPLLFDFENCFFFGGDFFCLMIFSKNTCDYGLINCSIACFYANVLLYLWILLFIGFSWSF